MKLFPGLTEYFKAYPQEKAKHHFSKDKIIELINTLYGLKQSGNLWQKKVKTFMVKRGFLPLKLDNAIYVNHELGIIIAIYVDDFLMLGADRRALSALAADFNEEVRLNDLGDANWFVGVRIRRSSPTGDITIDQQ